MPCHVLGIFASVFRKSWTFDFYYIFELFSCFALILAILAPVFCIARVLTFIDFLVAFLCFETLFCSAFWCSLSSG